jgi:hypothetical protein
MAKWHLMNTPWALAVAGSLCLHLIVFSRFPWRPQPPTQPTTSHTPPIHKLTVTFLPTPPPPPPPPPPAQKPPKARAASRPPIRSGLASTLRPTPPPTPAFEPPSRTQASLLSTDETTPAPGPGPRQPASAPTPAAALNLALPPSRSAHAAPGAPASQGPSGDLQQAIRARIEGERLQQQTATAKDGNTTQIQERVNGDGTRRAKIETPWGTYCLNSPRQGAPRDARMPSHTVVPSTCP